MLNNFAELKEFWHAELLGEDKKFSWLKILRRVNRSNPHNCLFWLRLSQYLYNKKNRTVKSWGKRINKSLVRKFGVEITLGAEIDKGLWLGHPTAIVVFSGLRMGKNCSIRQCTTIGSSRPGSKGISIGDSVSIGANSCIIGDDLRIGNNVNIGAMSFVNKDIPDNSVYITHKENSIRPK
ncbi:acetyltransferase [Halopseudomonas oceani]|uniref:Serine acetyltransferase n=1 Tax=Halopseudomonas oceani TaxID=1708783 RepID=A0A2P4EXY9_9GAMM|nr:serine acetyltransferase [Halopseudomonas oceani]POB05094.1 serine acetyltransferase [Halopseudomonas oceani]GGE33096.1 acetyltransferase [Halopseudomonas oceani]